VVAVLAMAVIGLEMGKGGMMIEPVVLGDCTLYLGDYTQMPEVIVNSVLTDPPYDYIFPESGIAKCKGNLLCFCKPENQFFVPDEYLFWIKTPSTKNYKNNCGRFVEIILVDRGHNAPFNQLHWSQMTGVYDDRLIYPPIHPFEKPLSLIKRLVRIYTNPGDIVYDPFMGSCVTGVACVQLGRKFIGCEINPKYFEIAVKRIKEAQLQMRLEI